MPPKGVEIGKMARVIKALPPDFRPRFGGEHHQAAQFCFPQNFQRFTLRIVLHAGKMKPGVQWRRDNVFNQPVLRPNSNNLADERLA